MNIQVHSYLFFVCRLVRGEIEENKLPIKHDSIIHCFDFNDALEVGNKMRPAYEYGEASKYYDENSGLRFFVADFAIRLKQFGDAVLRGDLSIFPTMERKIKDRANVYK